MKVVWRSDPLKLVNPFRWKSSNEAWCVNLFRVWWKVGFGGDKNVYRAHKNAFKISAECVSSKVWKENQLGCVPLRKSFPGIWHRQRKKKFCENDAFACWMMAFVIPTALRNQHLTTKVKDQRDLLESFLVERPSTRNLVHALCLLATTSLPRARVIVPLEDAWMMAINVWQQRVSAVRSTNKTLATSRCSPFRTRVEWVGILKNSYET